MKRGERLPKFIPQWIKRRIETDIYLLYDFGSQVGASLPEGARVLDAGAGQGRFKEDFSHTNYVAIDLAVGDPIWDYTKLDVIGDLILLPFGEHSFDAVFCAQVLEHVSDPFTITQEFGRVIKPGGRLFLTAPQSWPQHQKPNDFFRYTSFGLRHLINHAGLRPESIEPMGGYFWYLSFQLQNINYWLFPLGMPGRKWTWPIRAILGLVFQLFFPLVLYSLDSLDRQKDETLGYLCIASKPNGEHEHQG
jgi:SAM-dependent methyltransferase